MDMARSSPGIRAKAVKAIGLVLEVDASLLHLPELRCGISHALQVRFQTPERSTVSVQPCGAMSTAYTQCSARLLVGNSPPERELEPHPASWYGSCLMLCPAAEGHCHAHDLSKLLRLPHSSACHWLCILASTLTGLQPT